MAEFSLEFTTPIVLLEEKVTQDVNFIDPPPDSLQCPICLSILKQPHLLSCCGRHICEVNACHCTSILLWPFRNVLDMLKLMDSRALFVERKITCIYWTREQEARC